MPNKYKSSLAAFEECNVSGLGFLAIYTFGPHTTSTVVLWSVRLRFDDADDVNFVMFIVESGSVTARCKETDQKSIFIL